MVSREPEIHIDNSNGLFDWINNESITFPITVRAWSRDWFETESGDLEPSEAGWNLIIKDLGGPGGTQLTPAEVTVTADVKPTLEDAEGGVKLSDLAKFTIEEGVGHSPRFSITLRNVPEGVEVVNMMKTTSDGEIVWTAYGQGDQDALDDLVKSISLKLPDHWNQTRQPGPRVEILKSTSRLTFPAAIKVQLRWKIWHL